MAWNVLSELLDKLAQFNNGRSWQLRKSVGKDGELLERLGHALISPTVDVITAGCVIVTGLVSVPSGASQEHAARALREVAVLMVDGDICRHLAELLKYDHPPFATQIQHTDASYRQSHAEIQPAAMKALTKIAFCLGPTKDDRKPIMDLISSQKKALTHATEAEVKTAALAMFAELEPPGRSLFKSFMGKR